MNADGRRDPSDYLMDGWMDEEGFISLLNALDECRAAKGIFVQHINAYPSPEHCFQCSARGCFAVWVTRDITGSIEILIAFGNEYLGSCMYRMTCLAEDLILSETCAGNPYIYARTISDSFRYNGGRDLPPGSRRPPVLWIGLAPKDRDRLQTELKGQR